MNCFALVLKVCPTVLRDGGEMSFFVPKEITPAARFPICLLDLSLPNNDCLQVLGALRNAERFADMPVIIISSSAKPSPLPENLRTPSLLAHGALEANPTFRFSPPLESIVDFRLITRWDNTRLADRSRSTG